MMVGIARNLNGLPTVTKLIYREGDGVMKYSNIREIFRNGCIGVLLTLSTSTLVEAACIQDNLRGTWYLYGVSADTFSGFFDEWDRCKVRIGSTGNVLARRSSCLFRDSAGKGSVNIAGGSLIIKSGCNFSGNIKVCEGGQCGTVKVEHGHLDRGKSVMSLVGYEVGDADQVFSLTGIKQ
jgi:hypothetical protein